MRPLLLTCAFLVSSITPLSAQKAAPGWDRVESLKAGTPIHLAAKTRTVCRVVHVDETSLTCTRHGSGGPTFVVPREQVHTVRQAHRVRSMLIGGGVGFGIGFGIGFAAGTNNQQGFFGPNFLRGAVAGVGGVIGLLIGTPIGYFTDPSETLYAAP